MVISYLYAGYNGKSQWGRKKIQYREEKNPCELAVTAKACVGREAVTAEIRTIKERLDVHCNKGKVPSVVKSLPRAHKA